MLDFYAHIWFWLVACLIVGGTTGALARRAPRRKGPARWLVWGLLALSAGAAAAALGALPGAIALHLESALACFGAFLAGAAAGALAVRGDLASHESWALGLIPVAALWAAAALFATPAYEAQLQKRIVALAQASGVDPSGVGLVGRDVVAPRAVTQNKALTDLIAAAPGVRRILAANEPAPPPEPEKPIVAAEPERAPSAPDAAADPGAVLAALGNGELDAAKCQQALAAVAAVEPVGFHPARSSINRRTARALDRAAEIIRRCPDSTIEVRGFGDRDSVDPLSERRARAAERYLRREGVGGRKLVAIGCCAPEAKAAHTSAIEFIVR